TGLRTGGGMAGRLNRSPLRRPPGRRAFRPGRAKRLAGQGRPAGCRDRCRAQVARGRRPAGDKGRVGSGGRVEPPRRLPSVAGIVMITVELGKPCRRPRTSVSLVLLCALPATI